ncbi:hypothetical protein OBBRIDRAFT_864829, partial [Obba rivulosa]
MSVFGPDVISEVTAILQTTWIDSKCAVAVSTLVFYDHISTLSREVEFIWGRKITSSTILFYLNRWMILTWAVMNLTAEFYIFPTLSVIDPGRIMLNQWLGFSAVRVYAVSGGSWWPAIAVGALNLVPFGTNAVKITYINASSCTILFTTNF